MIEKTNLAFELQPMAREKPGEETKEQNSPSLVPSSVIKRVYKHPNHPI